MESAALRRAPPAPELIRLSLIGVLLVVAFVGWLVTDARMAGMDAGPGTDPGTLGFWVTAWVVMMAAMMFPSIAPMVVMHARVQEGKRKRGDAVQAGATAAFVAGYLITWTAAGLVAYAVFELGRTADVEALSWDSAGPYVAGAVIFAAAIYQFTPLKNACLTKCRSPFMFLLEAWKPGRLGALRMGIQHGGWCVGCCWGLMGALFALGVMSVGWMAFIAALIAIEKMLPWKAIANRGIAVLLLVLGVAVAFTPEDVPGLTLPGSPEATRAMEAMGMRGPAAEDAGMQSEGIGGGAGQARMEGHPGMDDQGAP